MKTQNQVKRPGKEIEAIKRELLALGPMHPGNISQQYHACGNPACRCHHPTQPEKHGPYNKLTYVHRGKTVCRFVRVEYVPDMQTRLAAYKTFRALMDKWIELSIQNGIADFFDQTDKPRPKHPKKPQ
jgi:hypothetical protein